MGMATIYAKTHLRILLNQNIWDYSIPVLKVSWDTQIKAILMCLVPILVGVIFDGIICSKTPFMGLAPIYEVKDVLIHIRVNIDIVHRYQECAYHGK